MISDSIDSRRLSDERRTTTLKLVAGICALLVTALLFGGYAYLRKRHAQQTLQSLAAAEAAANPPKVRPKAEVVVDEPLLNGNDRIIGGTVRNISEEPLTGLSVKFELRRRADAKLEEVAVPVSPGRIEANQNGTYSLKIAAQKYNSIRLTSLNSDPNSSAVAFTSSQGKQRPPERLEGKTIIVTKPGSKTGEFLNSPDNPARVP